MLRLSESDRRFFGLVARAAYANPFGNERATLDGEIADTHADDPKVMARLLARLTERLNALRTEGRADQTKYSEEDRERLRAAVLFQEFHRFLPDIDQHILGEERSQGPQRVPYAAPLFRELEPYGIRAAGAVRMLELFYQIRRAHCFIRERLVGLGTSMRRVREELWNAVFTRDIRRYERYLWNRMEDFSLLILGETGTGKGQAAMAVGASGFIAFDEKKGAFTRCFADSLVSLNLSAFPETLIESELFGHRKGAFTGAVDHHAGALARVPPHGTIFLDEIGEVKEALQIKLLRVLSERTYSEVGGHTEHRFGGRVMAATHRSIDALRSEGRLRHDFFYRLCASTVALPPLRVRLAEEPAELDVLVAHIVARVLGEPAAALAEEITQVIRRDLASHLFAGNVRELEQAVRRVLLTGSCAPTATLAETLASAHALTADVERGEISAEHLLMKYCAMLYSRSNSYVEVARITGLDRRTAKKYAEACLDGLTQRPNSVPRGSPSTSPSVRRNLNV
jgi:hypothetical protein